MGKQEEVDFKLVGSRTKKIYFDADQLSESHNQMAVQIKSNMQLKMNENNEQQLLKFVNIIGIKNPKTEKSIFDVTIETIYLINTEINISGNKLKEMIENSKSLKKELGDPVINILVDDFSSVTIRANGNPSILPKDKIEKILFQDM